jgi:hypothetical protein
VRTTQVLAIVSEPQFQPEILRRVTGSEDTLYDSRRRAHVKRSQFGDACDGHSFGQTARERAKIRRGQKE